MRAIVTNLLCAFFMAATTASNPGPLWAAEEGVRQPVSILALDEQGRIMVECEVGFAPDWVCYGVGDPLGLELDAAVSWDLPDEDDAACDDGVDAAAAAALSNFQLILRDAGTDKQCLPPIEPVGSFYMATMFDGGIAILRLPKERNPASVVVGYQSTRYQMERASPLDIAALLLNGVPNQPGSYKPSPEDIVAGADLASLVSFETRQGQDIALQNAAESICALAEMYKTKHGQYPHSMCQLYTGPTAIVSSIPRNPYDFDKTLCATEYATEPLDGVIMYYAETSGDTPETDTAVGYWVAVLNSGEAADPKLPLPAKYGMPLRAVKWFESHPALN